MAIRVNVSGGGNPAVRLGVSQNDFTLSREAEAWAVGTRNGVAVTAGDPAYHNNAKYYADNAQPIDDTAGIGDTGKVWSADKSANEVGTLNSAIPAIISNLSTDEATLTLEQGAISSSAGTDTSGSSVNYYKRIRTVGFIENPMDGVIEFNIPSGYWAAVSQYSTNSTSGFIGNVSGRVSGIRYLNLEAKYIRITFGRDDDGTISPTDLPTTNPIVTFYHGTDKTLTIENAPADAKKTGDQLAKKLQVASFTGGTQASAQDVNTLCRINTNGITDLPDNFGASSRTAWLFTFAGSVRAMQIFLSLSYPAIAIYYRNGDIGAYGSWKKIEQRYQLYPTGDDTSRSQEILNWMDYNNGVCKLAPGVYYIDSFEMPEGGMLEGDGIDRTRLIVKNTGTHSYAIKANDQVTICNLTLEANAENPIPAENYSLGIHGILLGTMTGSSVAQDNECTFENLIIKNFTGCGFAARKSSKSVFGCTFKNVRAQYCSAGFYFGEHAEYNTAIGCYATRCYTGLVLIGGNNIFSACVFGENEVNANLKSTDTYGGHDNDGHGIIQGCKFTHAGYYSELQSDGQQNDGYDLLGGAQTSAELIADCFFGYPIYIQNRDQPLMITGCQIRRECSITSDNSKIAMFNCMWQDKTSPVTTLNGGVIRMRDCVAYDGTDLSNN